MDPFTVNGKDYNRQVLHTTQEIPQMNESDNFGSGYLSLADATDGMVAVQTEPIKSSKDVCCLQISEIPRMLSG